MRRAIEAAGVRLVFDPKRGAVGILLQGADPDLFFGPDAEFVNARKVRVAEAKAICARCPARAACLAYALADSDLRGVWGGVSERERRRMRGTRRSLAN